MMKDYSKYIHKSRYARWNEKAKRRETYPETIDRYITFMYNQAKENTIISEDELHNLYLILGATCEE